MKFVIKAILIAGLCYLTQLILPFWIVAVVAFIINLTIQSSGWSSFFSGFIGVAALWFIVASGIDSRTSSILTEKVAEVFFIDNLLLMCVTALIGGLVTGFGGLSARMLFSRKAKAGRSGSKYYS